MPVTSLGILFCIPNTSRPLHYLTQQHSSPFLNSVKGSSSSNPSNRKLDLRREYFNCMDRCQYATRPVGKLQLLDVLEESSKAAALQSKPDVTCSLRLPELSHPLQYVLLWYKTCSLHHLQINYASRMGLTHIFNLQLLFLPTFPN